MASESEGVWGWLDGSEESGAQSSSDNDWREVIQKPSTHTPRASESDVEESDEGAELGITEAQAAGEASPEDEGGVQGPEEHQEVNIDEPAAAKKKGSKLGGG